MKLTETGSDHVFGVEIKEVQITPFIFNKKYEEKEALLLKKYNAYSVFFYRKGKKCFAKLIGIGQGNR